MQNDEAYMRILDNPDSMRVYANANEFGILTTPDFESVRSEFRKRMEGENG